MDTDIPCWPEPSPTLDADGIDVSLIRWALSLTPLQRLRVLQEQINRWQERRLRDPKTPRPFLWTRPTEE
jgi:hypothetical protein